MLMSINALRRMHEKLSDEESAFDFYHRIHNFDLLPGEHALRELSERQVAAMRSVNRSDFLKEFLKARALNRGEIIHGRSPPP